MDFVIVNASNQVNGEIPFDLKMSSSTDDFAESSSELEDILDQVIEAFDMQPADDIFYPEIFSRQREFLNSDDPVDKNRRIADATRILKLFPEINPDSIDVQITESNKLQVQFSTITGTEFRREL
jgi:hypothetical protein